MWWTRTKSMNSFWYFSQVFFAAAQKFWVASISVLVLSMSASRGDRAAPFLAKISWSFSLVLRSIWLCFLSMIAWALRSPDSICSNNLLRCSISSSYLKRFKSLCFSLDKFLNSSSRGKNLLLITLEYLISEHVGYFFFHRKTQACALLMNEQYKNSPALLSIFGKKILLCTLITYYLDITGQVISERNFGDLSTLVARAKILTKISRVFWEIKTPKFISEITWPE